MQQLAAAELDDVATRHPSTETFLRTSLWVYRIFWLNDGHYF
jgi:hypothetical protein